MFTTQESSLNGDISIYNEILWICDGRYIDIPSKLHLWFQDYRYMDDFFSTIHGFRQFSLTEKFIFSLIWPDAVMGKDML